MGTTNQEPSLKSYPFLLVNSRSQYIFRYGLLKVQQSFSLLLVVKLDGIIFLR